MNNDIGVGILDLYDQESLNKCLSSIKNIPDNNKIVCSLTKNKNSLENKKTYTSQTSLATLRNYIISQFRLKNLKYFFLIHSNQIIKNENVFLDTIKLAETFGTWFITGFNKTTLTVEDDSKLELNITSKLNSNFIFFPSGFVKTNGYFEERFFNGKELDVLDYIIRLRLKNAVLPPHYYSCIPENWLESTDSKIEAIDYLEAPDNGKSIQLAYGYFMHLYKYIPGESEQPSVSSDELMKSLETLQKIYSKNDKNV
jgi:hypothetical protein